MVFYSLTFYLFSSVAVLSALMVISAKNPVHSVLFLILSFVNASGLFVLLGAEFLAMILVVVYVGAVAVLFLFVVMMLDINFVKLREGFLHDTAYDPVTSKIAGSNRHYLGGMDIFSHLRNAASSNSRATDQRW